MSIAHARELIRLKRWPEAMTALTPALADPQASAEPWCMLALCQLSADEHRKARTSAQRALAIEPDSEWAHRLLASVELRCRRPGAALRSAERAVELAPTLAEPLYVLTQIQLERRRRREAEAIASRNLAANPQSALAWEAAATVALKQRRWADAERFARSGLAIDPQDSDLILHLGCALDGQGRSGEAGEAYAAVGRADPTDHRARQALGRLGLPVLGGGSVLLGKALLPVAANSIRLALVGSGIRPATVAIGVGVIMAAVYGVLAVMHGRAARRLAPRLREVAARQRREDARRWLAAVAIVAAVLALVSFLMGDPVTGVTLCAVIVGALGWRRLWSRGVPATAPWRVRLARTRRMVQSMRWRLR